MDIGPSFDARTQPMDQRGEAQAATGARENGRWADDPDVDNDQYSV
jgi:hypothetical protein